MEIMKSGLVTFFIFHFRIRELFNVLVRKKWFDYTVLFFIALNCITLAMERPDIPPDSIVSIVSLILFFKFGF